MKQANTHTHIISFAGEDRRSFNKEEPQRKKKKNEED